jgi:hypothetical protein
VVLQNREQDQLPLQRDEGASVHRRLPRGGGLGAPR